VRDKLDRLLSDAAKSMGYNNSENPLPVVETSDGSLFDLIPFSGVVCEDKTEITVGLASSRDNQHACFLYFDRGNDDMDVYLISHTELIALCSCMTAMVAELLSAAGSEVNEEGSAD